MCWCCNCRKNKVIDHDQMKKDLDDINTLNESIIKDFEVQSKNEDENNLTLDKKPKIEDYYFGRPVKNEFYDLDLYSMEIEEIILGIHPTIYKDKKGNFEKSFHPFFYLRLYNPDIENFGVIVQYIFVPKDAKQIHLYEKNGVEFIEKTYEVFENELRLIFNRINVIISNLSKWVISYKSKEFDSNMTLKKFFEIALPAKGEFTQDKLEGLKKTCIEFCIQTIQNLKLKKKKAKAINEIKENMRSVLEMTKGCKNYGKYVEGFNQLFKVIEMNK